MCAKMQEQSTIKEHVVKEDDTDIYEILRKLATSHAKKKKKTLVLMYNIIIPIIYNKKKSHIPVNIKVLHTFFFLFLSMSS
jgi:hypothetical protein